MSAPEPLSLEDVKYYETDPQQLVLGLWFADIDGRPRPTVGAIRQIVASRLSLVPVRFRQRIEPGRGGLPPMWVDDLEFNVNRHVVEAELGPRPTDAELNEYGAKLLVKPFDLSHSPWRLDVVPECADGRLAAFATLHHIIGDATTGLAAVVAMTLDVEPSPDPSAGQPHDPWLPERHGRRALARAAAQGQLATISQAAQALRVANGTLEPGTGRRSAVVDSVVLLRSWKRRPVKPAVFNGPPSRELHVHRFQLPVADVRDAMKLIGGGVTVNDAVLTAVASGMRNWLIERDAELFDLTIRVPVRAKSASATVGNTAIAIVRATLPITAPTPLARIRRVHDELTMLKETDEAGRVRSLTTLTKLLPIPLGKRATHWAQSVIGGSNMIVSNFSGAPIPLYLMGSPVLIPFPFVGINSRDGIKVTTSSHNGQLLCGIVINKATVPDAQAAAAAIEAGFSEILELGETLRLLEGVSIFAPLSFEELDVIAGKLQRVELAAGEILFEQGAAGDTFYIVEGGRLDVLVDGELKRTVARGDAFGEVALLLDQARTATVLAPDGAKLLAVDGEAMRELVLENPISARIAKAVLQTRVRA